MSRRIGKRVIWDRLDGDSNSVGNSQHTKQRGISPSTTRSISHDPQPTQELVVDETLNSTAQSEKTGRGPTTMPDWWGKGYKKLNVVFNTYGQPCGGDFKELSRVVWVFARDAHLIPLTYDEWTDVPQRVLDGIWKEIKDNTNAPDHYKSVCFDSLHSSWKDWKGRVKKNYYNKYSTDEERLLHSPPLVVHTQWKALIEKWGKELDMKRAAQNKKNRTKHVCPPRTGRRPFPVIIKERQDGGLETDRISIFKYTRSGKSRSKDKETADSSHDLDDHSNDQNSEDSHDDPRMQIIEQMDEKLAELMEEERANPEMRENIFREIMGKDCRGRVRCYGTVVSQSVIFGTEKYSKAGYSSVEDEIRAQKALIESQQAILSVQEAKIKELEAQQAEFQRQLNAVLGARDNRSTASSPNVVRDASSSYR